MIQRSQRTKKKSKTYLETKGNDTKCVFCGWIGEKLYCMNWMCGHFNKQQCAQCMNEHVCIKKFNNEGQRVKDDDIEDNHNENDGAINLLSLNLQSKKRKCLSTVQKEKFRAIKKPKLIMKNKPFNNITSSEEEEEEEEVKDDVTLVNRML